MGISDSPQGVTTAFRLSLYTAAYPKTFLFS
jgi:hypothetical protein